MTKKKSNGQRVADDFERRMRRFNVSIRGLSLSPEEVATVKERMERETKMTIALLEETSARRKQ